MSMIRIEEVGGKSLERAEKLLAGFPGGVDKAVKSAMSRALSHLRTNSAKEIRKKNAISTAAIRAEENIRTRYTYTPGSGISGYVLFSGHRIPLYRYNGASPVQPIKDESRWVKVPVKGEESWQHPNLPAYGHQFNSTSPVRFKDAFVARMSNGHVGIFERTGGMTDKGSEEIAEKMGSSVPTMLGNEEVQQALVEGTMKKFEERLAHEVDVILAGLR